MIGWSDEDISELTGIIEHIASQTGVNIPSNEKTYNDALKFILQKGLSNPIETVIDITSEQILNAHNVNIPLTIPIEDITQTVDYVNRYKRICIDIKVIIEMISGTTAYGSEGNLNICSIAKNGSVTPLVPLGYLTDSTQDKTRNVIIFSMTDLLINYIDPITAFSYGYLALKANSALINGNGTIKATIIQTFKNL